MTHRRNLEGPLLLGLVYLVPLLLWWDAVALSLRGDQTSTVLSSLALGVGIAGFCAFAANIVLGGRLPVVDRYFGGLEAMYRVHRINGRIAYLLVASHVVLVVASRAVDSWSAALRLLSPSADGPVVLGALAFVAMSASIAATLYARLTHETFVYVQRSFGIIFAIAGTHVFLTAGAKASSGALTAYLALLGGAALAAFLYRSLFGNILVRRYDYLVTAVVPLDENVVEIKMEPVNRALSARPGQFVFVTFYSDAFNAQFHPVSIEAQEGSAVIVLRPGDARDQFHPFSLTSAGGSRELRLAIKAVGDFTSGLRKLDAGAAARVEGPYGEFSHLNMRRPRQIWLAGGIGITPFLSMARSLAGDGFEIDLFWGVNTRSQAYFADELRAISERVEGFRFHLVVEETDGFISPELVAEASGYQAAEILIVGPPAMEQALRARFIEVGVPERSIHSERFAFGPRR